MEPHRLARAARLNRLYCLGDQGANNSSESANSGPHIGFAGGYLTQARVEWPSYSRGGSSLMSPEIFQQRSRWLEELGEYLRDEAQVICEAAYMTLPAITDEIVEAANDPRTHTAQQAYDWLSRANDLDDALTWLGPDSRAVVDAAVIDLHTSITAGLLATKNGKPSLDDSKRPDVARKATVVVAQLQQDNVLAAAWCDLVAACKTVDHTVFPVERVKYLRDNVFALCRRRKQDPGAFGPIDTAYEVLLGSDRTVRRAQSILGDALNTPEPGVSSDSSLSLVELETLAARSIVARTPTGDFVVWFRIARAYIRGATSTSHGDVTFYPATSLAVTVTDHDAARKLYDVVPEELLTQEVRATQLSDTDGPDGHRGFEHTPALVYARVAVQGVERHLAESRARTLLDAVLKVGGTPDDLWQILRGSLIFGDKLRYNYHSLSWGPKEEYVSHALDYENDYFTKTLGRLADQGATITARSAEALIPVLRLQDELDHAPDEDPEAVVRAAVRAIEHCNTRTEQGHLSWADFLSRYLLDFYTVETFAHRAVQGVFAAAVANIPDHSPGAPRVPELGRVAEDIQEDKSHGLIVRSKTVTHTPVLRRLYKDHWLARSLAELDDTLATANALSVAFDAETKRVDTSTARLRRTRNAAIHGGPISATACQTIAPFARRIAGLALSNVIEATINGVQVEAHTRGRRSRYQQRVQNLTVTGDLENLFDLPAVRP